MLSIRYGTGIQTKQRKADTILVFHLSISFTRFLKGSFMHRALFLRPLFRILLIFCTVFATPLAISQATPDYLLGAGDVVRFNVFQQPDLSIEVRVSEGGTISYPLIGLVKIGGLTPSQAEVLVATKLKEGNFIQSPQISLNVMQFKSAQVSVLGNVNRPGRYPLEQNTMRLTEVLALAGGVIPGVGADSVVLIAERNGKLQRMEIDLVALFAGSDLAKDVALKGGDSLFVNKAPIFYIYGQVQRAGSFPLDRGMTMAQGIAKGGGVTLRGTEKSFRVQRKNTAGAAEWLDGAKLEDIVRPDDLIFIRESLF
jgi:polysaccharide biosynthesis/export protein